MGLLVGAGTKIINCEVGDLLAGQLHKRVCTRINDDLEANALFIAEGKETALIINCDLVHLDRSFTDDVFAEIELQTKIPAKNIIIGCSHTHTGPHTYTILYDALPNEKYLENLKGWLVQLSREAMAAAKPAKIGSASGTALIGYNRRICWQDGTHSMYGDARKPGFNGLEGPNDPGHSVLFALDEKDELLGILHNNSCHATCLEMATFATSDFPGAARSLIRSTLNKKLPVLYLQGASGDLSPWNLLYQHRVGNNEDGEKRVREIGITLAGETLRLIADNATKAGSPLLKTNYAEIEIGIRIPDKTEMAEAEKTVEKGEAKAGRDNYVLARNVLKLHSEFKDKPSEKILIHTIRIGDLAITTNPFELYCQFGLDIKHRSPAKITMISQLTNGSGMYCPTIYGRMGKGYSGETNYDSRVEPYAGYKVVETAVRLLYQLY